MDFTVDEFIKISDRHVELKQELSFYENIQRKMMENIEKVGRRDGFITDTKTLMGYRIDKKNRTIIVDTYDTKENADLKPIVLLDMSEVINAG